MAFIHESVRIGKNCSVGPFCVLEKGVVLGDHVTLCSSVVLKENVVIGTGGYIEDHVTIAHCTIGENVFIKTGARIGQAGFGFDMSEKGPIDIPQIGKVIIKNNVQIGANTCVDRGSLSDTIIFDGVRIDNLVQIAHNVVIKENTVIVAQSGIAGSSSIGKYSVLGGQVGVAGHLSIGNFVKIAAQSGVMKDVGDNQTMGGSPAITVGEWHRQTIFLKNMVRKKN
jgi:UDP-3-O-[3-hydroxymyristoyl] glucosamine N-acyltransferase